MGVFNAKYLPLTNAKIVCDGNSITNEARPVEGDNYPIQLAANPTIVASGATIFNAAVSGQNTGAMIGRGPTVVDPQLVADVSNIVIAWEQTNDIFNGRSAVEAVDRMETYCNDRTAAGWDAIIVISALARNKSNGSGSIDLSKNPVLNESNYILFNRWRNFATRLLDVRTIGQLHPIQPDYMPDQVHPNELGLSFLIPRLVRLLQRLPAK